MSIGEIIRNYRNAANLTQADLGKRVFKSAQVISNWERGYTRGITADDLSNLSLALNIPPGELIKENMTDALMQSRDNKPNPIKQMLDLYQHLTPEKKKQARSYIAFLAQDNNMV